MISTHEFNGMKIDTVKPFRQDPKGQAIFLHGFPGQMSQNVDLANRMAADQQIQSLIPIYKGLGRSAGVFSFIQCLEDCEKLLLEQKEPVWLVGHSFGGFLALNLANLHREKVLGLILLAPLSDMPNLAHAEEIIQFVAHTQNQIRQEAIDIQGLIGEFHSLKTEYTTEAMTENLMEVPTLLFHGRQDDTIEVSQSQRLAARLNKVEYHEIDDDHRIGQRDYMFEKVNGFLSRSV